MSRSDVLISPSELRARIGDVIVLDVRWRLGDAPGAGRQRYAAAHLPGAAYLDLEKVLTSHSGNPREGRHPLPDLATLERGLLDVGVAGQRPVVVYDEAASLAAGRAWWVLTWAGIPTRMLDGGIEAWVAAGHPTESGERLGLRADHSARTGPIPVITGHPVVTPGRLPTVDATGAAAAGTQPDRLLVDVRAPERFRGETEPLDPVAGHIPGAINLPAAALFTADGHLADDDTLRDLLGPAVVAAGRGEQVVVYCGSGITAAQAILALRAVGVDATLYPGSWSAWCNDPARPIATGA